jgi:hypothetical protein
MSRTREVLRKGVWYQLDLDAPLPPRKTPYIISDIKEYPSVITGEMISSRSHHRDHLRAHGCIEVGNEVMTRREEPLPPVKDDIKAALQASPEFHAEARAISEEATPEFSAAG